VRTEQRSLKDQSVTAGDRGIVEDRSQEDVMPFGARHILEVQERRLRHKPQPLGATALRVKHRVPGSLDERGGVPQISLVQRESVLYSNACNCLVGHESLLSMVVVASAARGRAENLAGGARENTNSDPRHAGAIEPRHELWLRSQTSDSGDPPHSIAA
jgi:hypothetical protein